MSSARELLERLLERRDLSQAEAEELLTHLTNPEGSPVVAGAILAALRTKGAVADEVRGFASAMRRLAPAMASSRSILKPVSFERRGCASSFRISRCIF